MIIVQRHDRAARRNLRRRRDKQELRRNEHRFEHQAEGRGVGEMVVAPEIENAHEHIELRLRGRAAIGVAGERAGHRARRRAGIRAGRRGFTEEPLLQRSRRRVGGRHDAIHDGIGDSEILLGLERRQRIQIALTEDFIRQSTGDCRVDAEEIVQRVAVFRLGQATDHKGTGVLRAEKLDLADPVEKRFSLGVGRLFRRVLRGHVVGLDVGEGLLPPLAEGRVAGGLECGFEVDPALGFPVAVTVQAIRADKGCDLIAKGFFRLGLQRGKFRVVRRIPFGREGQKGRQAENEQSDHATGKICR